MRLAANGLLERSNPVYNYILDDVTGATLAYSVRKLRAGYTGYAFRISRNSDQAELDVPFNGNYVDVNYIIIHCLGTTGVIKTLYDQMGSNNATQTVAVNRPIVYQSGNLVKNSNGYLAFNFVYASSHSFELTTAITTSPLVFTSYNVQQRTYTGTPSVTLGEANTNDAHTGIEWYDGNAYAATNASYGYWASNDITFKLTTYTGTGNTYEYRKNGVSQTITGVGVGAKSVNLHCFGKFVNQPGDAKVSEYILYPTVHNSTDLNTCETNIKTFYNL